MFNGYIPINIRTFNVKQNSRYYKRMGEKGVYVQKQNSLKDVVQVKPEESRLMNRKCGLQEMALIIFWSHTFNDIYDLYTSQHKSSGLRPKV